MSFSFSPQHDSLKNNKIKNLSFQCTSTGKIFRIELSIAKILDQSMALIVYTDTVNYKNIHFLKTQNTAIYVVL